MHASISPLYFSTQAADDAITATSPKMSMINPDNLQGTSKTLFKFMQATFLEALLYIKQNKLLYLIGPTQHKKPMKGRH